jgi:hypothetical protein
MSIPRRDFRLDTRGRQAMALPPTDLRGFNPNFWDSLIHVDVDSDLLVA